MFRRLILMVVVLGFFTILYGEVNPDTLPEKYTKKVIIEAKWGSGEGEFGLEPLPESHEYMTSFTVAPNGNIYIVDPNNCRINVYNQNGEFLKEIKVPQEFLIHIGEDTMASIEGMGVDSKGNIFIGNTSGGTRILKIDKNGKIVDRYAIKDIYLSPLYFYENNGEMYLWGTWTTGFNKPSDFLGDAYMPLSKIKGLEKERAISEVKSLTSGVFGVINKTKKISSLNLRGIDEDKWTIHTTVAPAPFRVIKKGRKKYIIYEDWLGNIKIESKKEVLFNESIRDLNKWSFQHPRLGITSVSADPIFDKDGNFYLISGDSYGLKIIKYIVNKEVWK